MKKSEKLLQLIDREIEILQRKTMLMEQMGRCAASGEIEPLPDLARRAMEIDQDSDEIETAMRKLCRELAREQRIESEEVSLGKLQEALEGPPGIALRDRRERLLVVVENLREAGQSTARVVRKALEINRKILSAVFGPQLENETYESDGEIKRSREGLTLRQSV